MMHGEKKLFQGTSTTVIIEDVTKMLGVHNVSIHVRPHSVFEIQPSRSPDPNLLSVVTSKNRSVFRPNLQRRHISTHFEACQTIPNRTGTIEIVLQSIIRRAHSCIDSRKRNFEHVLWTVTWEKIRTVIISGTCIVNVLFQLQVIYYTKK